MPQPFAYAWGNDEGVHAEVILEPHAPHSTVGPGRPPYYLAECYGNGYVETVLLDGRAFEFDGELSCNRLNDLTAALYALHSIIR